MGSELPNEPMDIDSSGGSEASPYVVQENDLNLFPVSVNESGEGLPYAPVDWPNHGDNWRWKVGRRIAPSGYFVDRYLYTPNSLRRPGERKGFASKLSVEHFIRAKFPNADVDAFFASFSWKIPSKLSKKDDKEMSRRSGGKAKNQDANAHISEASCKAGNKFCSSLSPAEDSVFSEVMFCDICCSERGFCRDCCCILCSGIIDKVRDGYSYIRCEAKSEGSTCGHCSHINCALRAYLAGTVSYGLDAEFYCRRCDSRTDLVPYVEKLLEGCRSFASRDDVEKVLGVGVCVLRGTKRTNAKQLLHCTESAMSKLMNGTNLEDIWTMEDVSADIAGPDPNVHGASDLPKKEESQDLEMGPPPLSSNFDHRAESLKLEFEIDHVLDLLRKSQEIEYKLAEERLLGQKRYLQHLYKQLENERSELSRHASSKDVRDLLLDSFLSRADQIKQEVLKLEDMEKVSKGFGKVPKHVLKEQFGLDNED